MMQAVGRRYVSAYNQRHRRSGALWDGRFRCAVVQAGATLLEVLCLIDGQAQDPIDLPRTTIGHRNGGQAWIPVADPPEYWALGNTPFDRERVYRELLIRGNSAERAQALRSAALGWLGSRQHRLCRASCQVRWTARSAPAARQASATCRLDKQQWHALCVQDVIPDCFVMSPINCPLAYIQIKQGQTPFVLLAANAALR
jgi:putative transposase